MQNMAANLIILLVKVILSIILYPEWSVVGTTTLDRECLSIRHNAEEGFF